MVTVRAMAEADIAAVSAIRVTGWKTAYAGILPRSYLDRMTVEEDLRQRRQRFTGSGQGPTDLVAVDADAGVVGWACFGPCRGTGADATAGELYALYARPALIGSGIGRALLGAVHEQARGWGVGVVVLWVLAGNGRARRFYEQAGYVADGGVQADDYDGVSVSEVRYRRAL